MKLMEKNKIPTAEEFLNDQGVPIDKLQNLPWFDYGNMSTWLVEFAKLHVQAALEAASKEAMISKNNGQVVGREFGNVTDGSYKVNKQSILNAYPLNKIK